MKFKASWNLKLIGDTYKDEMWVGDIVIIFISRLQ